MRTLFKSSPHNLFFPYIKQLENSKSDQSWKILSKKNICFRIWKRAVFFLKNLFFYFNTYKDKNSISSNKKINKLRIK